MLVKSKTSKKRLIIYAIIIVAMIIGNIYVFRLNSSSNLEKIDLAASNMTAAESGAASSAPSAKQPGQKKAASPLEHHLFSSLKKIGDWPIVPRNVGKADPFAPIAELIEQN